MSKALINTMTSPSLQQEGGGFDFLIDPSLPYFFIPDGAFNSFKADVGQFFGTADPQCGDKACVF